MQDGSVENIFFNAERAVKQMAACGLSHSAKSIQVLIQYAEALDKNQKAFIDLTLRQQRLLKKQQKLVNLCDIIMTRKQKRQINKWLKEKDK